MISLIVRPGYATMTSTYHTTSVLVCCNILYVAVFAFSVMMFSVARFISSLQKLLWLKLTAAVQTAA